MTNADSSGSRAAEQNQRRSTDADDGWSTKIKAAGIGTLTALIIAGIFGGVTIWFIGVRAGARIEGEAQRQTEEFRSATQRVVERQWRDLDDRIADSIPVLVGIAFAESMDGLQSRVGEFRDTLQSMEDSLRATLSRDARTLLDRLRNDSARARNILTALANDRGAGSSLLDEVRTRRDQADSLVERIQRWAETAVLLDTLTRRLETFVLTPEVMALLHENHPDVAFEEGSASFLSPQGGRVAYIGKASTGGGYARFYDNNEDDVAYIGVEGDGDGGLLMINDELRQDVAEVFQVVDHIDVALGTVVSILPSGGSLAPSGGAYDGRVVGVVSGAGGLRPGITIGGDPNGPSARSVAIAGQVYVRVNLEGGQVRPGDLMVASSVPGVAMRATDPARLAGTTVGKAMEPFDGAPNSSEGLVRILVMTR